MIIKNYEIGELQSFLFNLILKGKESRMRTRFIKLLEDQIELLKVERQQLINDYALKDENGEIVTETKEIHNKEEEIVLFQCEEAEKEAQLQIMLMMNEDFIMEETADKIEMLTVLQSIILNCDLEFTGNKAVLYDRFCEIFEEIELLND
ncbi:hypothetical protein [Lysinibacillus fusiformis]|uniref:hypothetical protein n=1 Tax=Lysinibacillus fusiformis TaxID=28031 RepID=UPI0004DAA2D1|nr:MULTISPECIES: hypothetical protein [Lysinibacillus]KEK09938.1 hypothetical protein EP18_22585 [Lysinibacillus sphaericus]MCK1987263.1 hypothetical protein [Lysinibacillus fusiformis]UXJ70193.1 hypothetical protein N5069_06570 [Lysinibacillus fusiformis]